MPLLRINATPQGFALHDPGQSARLLIARPGTGTGPVIIMLHGYKYDPSTYARCPHHKIFGTGPRSWPRALGFGVGDPQEGLGIALGWYARGPLARVHRRARDLGGRLATIISLLRASAPERPVHIIAHSMGSEAALSALEHLPAGAVDRIVLLTGASFAGRAQEMLRTPAGRRTEVFNITSRENDLFDMAFERLVPRYIPADHAIGRGISAPNACTLQLDCARTLDALSALDLPIGAPSRRICHWSAYTRPGVMALYTQLLRSPDKLPSGLLRSALPVTTAPRWSRLFAGTGTGAGHSGAASARPAMPLALRVKNRIMAGTQARGKNNEHAC